MAAVNAAAADAIRLDGGASVTRVATVPVELPPPIGSESIARLTLDGGATWLEVPYATAFPVTLTDARAGQ